jgi:uncharacterized protein (DUF58 family)
MPAAADSSKRVSLTRYGGLYLASLMAMLYGASNYQSNAGLLMVFILGATALVSVFHTRGALTGLSFAALPARPVFVGGAAVATLRVSAPGFRPRVFVKFPESAAAFVDAAPEGVDVELRLPAEKRGRLTPGPLTVQTHYPLGLFRCWMKTRVSVNIQVYPKPLPGPDASVPLGAAGVGEAPTKAPGGDDFHGLRLYQPGDPLQRIAWKASTRGPNLYTKAFTAAGGVEFHLDWKQLPSNMDVETRLSVLCDQVLKSARSGAVYGLRLPGVELPPGRGPAHEHRCLAALADYGLDEAP